MVIVSPDVGGVVRARACAKILGSDLASYINGQEIYVDGGWLSKGLKKD